MKNVRAAAVVMVGGCGGVVWWWWRGGKGPEAFNKNKNPTKKMPHS